MRLKSIITFALITLFCSTLFAQKKVTSDLSTIKGTWERSGIQTIKLYKISESSTLLEIASAKVGDDKRFALSFFPEKEGLYTIGTTIGKINQYSFYVKPGDQVNLKVAKDNYTLEGVNTDENKQLQKWHDFVQPIEQKAVYILTTQSTYVDFFPDFEQKVEAMATYPKSNTSNKTFNSFFEEYKKIDLLSIALNFVYTPRSAHPQGEDFPDYYRTIDAPSLTKTDALLNYPNGIDLLSKSMMMVAKFAEESKADKDKTVSPITLLFKNKGIDQIGNETIKGELFVMFAKSNTTYEGVTEYNTLYGKYMNTESQKKRFKAYEAELFAKSETTVPAIDFKFPDRDGKQISLSDFKGKVVYIDVWATWCGPCKKEIPFLKALEEKYHADKNMVFLSVSVDAQKDYEKWKTFLDVEKLGGIQIFAGAAAQEGIMNPYQIKGIPRFILVGKDGKMISIDAPRPSSSEIEAVLKNALK